MRMQSVTPPHKTFEPSKHFDAQNYVQNSLGRFAGEREYEVRNALDEHAAFYAREKPWHVSQQLTGRPGGRVELALRVNSLVDARHAVLQWGEHAEVLAPAELRAEVRAALKAALAQY
jgi:predicted DNA-binding transcriptional regulator YafY